MAKKIKKESKERKKYGLAVTCAASRHAEMIADDLIKNKLKDIVDEPQYAGESIKATVHALWKARAEIKKLKNEI